MGGLLPKVHLVVGVTALVLVPALSWLDGSGQLAWTMFSRTGMYRLELLAFDDSTTRAIAPSSLAAVAATEGRRVLGGADNWRMQDVGRATLARHLRDVAKLACQVSAARRVRVRLFSRTSVDAPLEIITEDAHCAR